MGNRNLIIVGVIVIVAVVGYVLLSNQAKTPTPPSLTPPPTAQPTEQEAVIGKEKTLTLAEQNKSGQTGVATLKEADGKVLVTVTMSGTLSDVPQPAHIHVGACPGVGAVKYPLTNIKDGSSETTLDVRLDQLMSELPLALNVHKSAAQIGVYTACADLEE